MGDETNQAPGNSEPQENKLQISKPEFFTRVAAIALTVIVMPFIFAVVTDDMVEFLQDSLPLMVSFLIYCLILHDRSNALIAGLPVFIGLSLIAVASILRSVGIEVDSWYPWASVALAVIVVVAATRGHRTIFKGDAVPWKAQAPTPSAQ